MLIKIEVEETTAFGFLKVWASMPHFADNSFIFHSSTEAIISYIFLFLFIGGVILYIIAIFKYIAREKRILQKAKSIFDIKLEEDTNQKYFFISSKEWSFITRVNFPFSWSSI